MAKLRDLEVRWLLPGHGDRCVFAHGDWARPIDDLLAHHSFEPAASRQDAASAGETELRG